MSETMLILGGHRNRRRPGRPTRAGVRSTERVEFVATKDERRRLAQVADDQGKPLATVIRDAVNEYVSDYGERKIFPSGPLPTHRTIPGE